MGVFKLGKMTLGSLFKKPETVLYPIEHKPQPLGLKGHIVVDVEQCILCGMCEKSCSTDCIKVDKAARTWQIQPYQCVQCGYCVQVCPKKCLSMDPNYWAASTSKDLNTIAIPEKEKGNAKKASVNVDEANGDSSKQDKLEQKLANMDPEKAAKVRAAMKAKEAKAVENKEGAAAEKSQPASSVQAAADTAPAVATKPVDRELEAKIAMMSEDKADIVRKALANR